jgi:hypothetical protein
LPGRLPGVGALGDGTGPRASETTETASKSTAADLEALRERLDGTEDVRKQRSATIDLDQTTSFDHVGFHHRIKMLELWDRHAICIRCAR